MRADSQLLISLIVRKFTKPFPAAKQFSVKMKRALELIKTTAMAFIILNMKKKN